MATSVNGKPINKRCARNDCKKKLSMVEREIKCLCGKCFCSKHRLPEDHYCTHDFSESAEKKEEKAEALKCVPEKVAKI